MRDTGCCTWIFGNEDLTAIAARVSRAGMDGVELHGDLSLDPAEAGRIFRDAGLRIFSITPATPISAIPTRPSAPRRWTIIAS